MFSPDEAAPDRLLPLTEVAALCGCSTRSLWRWIADGRLPAYKLGDRLVRVKPEDVASLLQPLAVGQ
jgi:excisionase family DNA binding protein